MDTPEDFVVSSINWCFNDLPLVPKLGAIFSEHNNYNLDAKGHYRWEINGGFRRLIDVRMLNFWSSNGEEPCRLNICYRDPESFYEKNGLISLRKPGVPCEYTIEQESDKIWLVLDRPLNIPLIVDIIAYGIPKPIASLDDEIEVSAIAEHLMISVMKSVWLQEAEDFNFSGSISDYIDNKLIPEAIQALNKRWSVAPQAILGEA